MAQRNIIESLQDLSSFDYKKVEASRGDPSNVKNLPSPPTRVTEVETKLISTNFSKLEQMDRGSNEVSGDSFHGFEDGFGNVALTAYKTVEDFKRFAKWQLTPKGLIFNIKQAILQRFNALTNTRIYNPLGLFGSLTPFVHLPRHTKGATALFADFNDPPTVWDLGSNESTGHYVKDNVDVVDKQHHTTDLAANVSKTLFGKTPGYKEKVYGGEYGFDEEFIKIDASKTGISRVYTRGVSNLLQVPYGGMSNHNLRSTNDGHVDLPKDYIKFRIRDLVNGKWLVFPAHLGTITDTVTPSWTPERYIGRPDSVHVYTGTDRSIGFDFKVAALTRQEIPIIQEKMNYLVGLGYPSYKKLFSGDSENRPVAPYISLTIGDMFVDTPGFFSSITLTTEEGATWELDEGHQTPQVFSVSVEFTYIGKYLPQTLGKHYEVPWLVDKGTRGSYQGTFSSYVNDHADAPTSDGMEMLRPKTLNAGDKRAWGSKITKHAKSVHG